MKFDWLNKIKPKSSLTKKIKLAKVKEMSMSKRDIILIGLLILGLEGYVLYSYFLSPKWQQFSALQTHYNAQKTLAKNLENDNAKKSQFQEQLKLLDYKLATLSKELPANVEQEEMILTLNQFASDQKLGIDSITFSNLASVSKKDFLAGKVPTTLSTTPADSSAKTPTAGGVNTSGIGSEGIVMVEDINISFSGSYGALYNFLSDLEKSDRKIITKGITLTRGDANLLKGEISVQYIGYKGPEDTGDYNLETPQIDGKSSPFLAYQGYDVQATGSQVTTAASVPVKSYDPNFYLVLNSADDNAPKVIFGDYAKDGTELYSNTNDKVTGKISISGTLDKMTYSYSIGSTVQTKSAKLMLDGGKLRLNVISTPRNTVTDKVGITLDIDNKTDYPLEVTVINDDANAPRFSIGNKSGSVIVK